MVKENVRNGANVRHVLPVKGSEASNPKPLKLAHRKRVKNPSVSQNRNASPRESSQKLRLNASQPRRRGKPLLVKAVAAAADVAAAGSAGNVGNARNNRPKPRLI